MRDVTYHQGRNLPLPTKLTGKRSELLGKTFEEEFKAQQLKLGALAERVYERLGYSSASGSTQLISQLRYGYVYGTPGTPQCPELQLYRLSVMLEELGLPEEHKLIRELRRIRCFEYPPVQNEGITKLLEDR
jgi:hypothetical protein